MDAWLSVVCDMLTVCVHMRMLVDLSCNGIV